MGEGSSVEEVSLLQAAVRPSGLHVTEAVHQQRWGGVGWHVGTPFTTRVPQASPVSLTHFLEQDPWREVPGPVISPLRTPVCLRGGHQVCWAAKLWGISRCSLGHQSCPGVSESEGAGGPEPLPAWAAGAWLCLPA